MPNLKIDPTYKSPLIIADEEKGLIEIKGRSLPENVSQVYEPLFQWIQEYIKNPRSTTTLNIQLEYFNTSTSKALMEIFNQLSILKQKGLDIKINWYYEEDDPDMEEQGEMFGKLTKLPIEMISVKEFIFDFYHNKDDQ
ncbi:MAG: hypothetical protein KatS3mg034_1583 [Vicingaceae bacterium]|nr:MAG: hypothetical protein KatS3mg034_1583 [Vicingaceae bacterium]